MTRRTDVAVALGLAVGVLVFLPPASAQNLLTNPGFQANTGGWFQTIGPGLTISRQAEDVGDDPASGALEVALATSFGVSRGDGARQCVPVVPRAHYDLAAWIRIQPGQPQGVASAYVRWYSEPGCTGSDMGSTGANLVPSDDGDRWSQVQTRNQTAPVGAKSAEVNLWVRKDVTTGMLDVLYDDVRFCRSGTCAVQLGPDLTTAAFPGFRFRVTIEGGDNAIAGEKETACLPETLCVSGALPGRTELELRLIGPRPNGYLWLQAVRFTPSRVVIRAEQIATGVVREYVLPAVGPAGRPCNRQDRMAFLP